jgi:phosphatidylglycerophosphate synthase
MILVELLADSPIRLWGLSSRERLRRQVAQLPGLRLQDGSVARAAGEAVLMLRTDYLFEVRTLKALLAKPDTVLRCAADGRPAAALVVNAPLDAVRGYLVDGQTPRPAAVGEIPAGDLAGFDATLRRVEPPLLEPLGTSRREDLESLLYGNAYKGITDLVTKWLWPRPARWGVRFCSALGIPPNAVTTFGVLLMVAASVLFSRGHYAAGLAAGWFMTYLDTVDGKLARVTVRSSRIGHILDHGMDIVHPPFWYVLWGASLAGFDPVLGLGRVDWSVVIVAGYVGGRLVEGIFEQLLGCAVFAWRPFDAAFRLVTARRNPVLIILTVATVCGRPDLGFVTAAVWTALSTIVLILRLVHGLWNRWRHGPLVSWLADGAGAEQIYPRAYRIFSGTQGAYRAR